MIVGSISLFSSIITCNSFSIKLSKEYRFAFTTDGCITFSKNKKPELNLACYNKTVSQEWQALFAEFGINGKVSHNKKSKQGCGGVRIYSYNSIKTFQNIGGFIDRVKISKKSKRYCGMQKNELLKIALREMEKRLESGHGRI